MARRWAATLCANGGEVLAIDINGERVELLRDHVTHCVEANGMNREALVQLGVRDFDVAVVAIDGDLRASCMTTMLMKELGVNYVAACAQDEVHGRMLTKLGADKVIFPERDMGKRVAHNLMAGNILDFIELSPDYSMVEIQVRRSGTARRLRSLTCASAWASTSSPSAATATSIPRPCPARCFPPPTACWSWPGTTSSTNWGRR